MFHRVHGRARVSRIAPVLIALVSCLAYGGPDSSRAFRLPPQNGWTFVHLEGTPAEVGRQHGRLLSREIDDVRRLADAELSHDLNRNWEFFREQARVMMWPRIEGEYREEMQGIADGAAAAGAKVDVWDIVALNGWLEWPYFVKFYNRTHHDSTRLPSVPEHCSAFAATGSYTRDGKPVLAHNNWSTYPEGARWTVIFDIAPASGQRILMDGIPGVIMSGDDFGVTGAGLMITETTISGFDGYDPGGIPEFVRARKAMQYATSIDSFATLMKQGNNGGYANDWLIADRKTGEIASLELGLKNVNLQRTMDGCLVSANFPIDPKLTREETTFDPRDSSCSSCARHLRWNQLMKRYKGIIDVDAAERFLADHFDMLEGADRPSERTLCGHVDASPRGMGSWQPPFGAAGAVTNKAVDATMAGGMSLAACAGHACGESFHAAEFLKAHPEFAWQAPFLRDMPAYPWKTFSSSTATAHTK